jgi:hypothetical protein
MNFGFVNNKSFFQQINNVMNKNLTSVQKVAQNLVSSVIGKKESNPSNQSELKTLQAITHQTPYYINNFNNSTDPNLICYQNNWNIDSCSPPHVNNQNNINSTLVRDDTNAINTVRTTGKGTLANDYGMSYDSTNSNMVTFNNVQDKNKNLSQGYCNRNINNQNFNKNNLVFSNDNQLSNMTKNNQDLNNCYLSNSGVNQYPDLTEIYYQGHVMNNANKGGDYMNQSCNLNEDFMTNGMNNNPNQGIINKSMNQDFRNNNNKMMNNGVHNSLNQGFSLNNNIMNYGIKNDIINPSNSVKNFNMNQINQNLNTGNPIIGNYTKTPMTNNGVSIKPWMTEKDIVCLLLRLKQATFPENMIIQLRNALLLGIQLTAKQAQRLLKVFNFDSDKKTACLIIYNNLFDKQNIDVMLEALTYDMSKKEIKKALGLF